MDIDELVVKALNHVNSDDYDSAVNTVQIILNNNEYLNKLNKKHWEIIGSVYLASGRFDLSWHSFSKAGSRIGISFLMILMNKLDDATKELLNTNDSPFKRWCIFLVELFSGKRVDNWTTFLEIRHFLEFTVYYLLLIKNQEFIDKILSVVNKLTYINSDSEKYIAYAYFNFGRINEAITMLNNVLRRDKYDGEAYYKLGEIYLSLNQKKQAIEMLEKAKIFFPSHIPLNTLLSRLKGSN